MLKTFGSALTVLLLLAGSAAAKENNLRQEVAGAKTDARTPQDPDPIESPRQVRRGTPIYDDIDRALDFLERAFGDTETRKCIERLIDEAELSIDPTLPATVQGDYHALTGAMRLNPRNLASQQSREKGAGDAKAFHQAAELFRRRIQLAGTLYHECIHVQQGLADEYMRTDEAREAATHPADYVLHWLLFRQAFERPEKYGARAMIPCGFLREILEIMRSKAAEVESYGGPEETVQRMKKEVEEARRRYEEICGDGHGRTEFAGSFDPDTDEFGGIVRRYWEVSLRAECECRGKSHPIGRIHGFDLDNPIGREGGVETILPPETVSSPVGDCVLDRVEVDGEPEKVHSSTSGPMVVLPIEKKHEVTVIYRCTKGRAGRTGRHREEEAGEELGARDLEGAVPGQGLARHELGGGAVHVPRDVVAGEELSLGCYYTDEPEAPDQSLVLEVGAEPTPVSRCPVPVSTAPWQEDLEVTLVDGDGVELDRREIPLPRLVEPQGEIVPPSELHPPPRDLDAASPLVGQNGRFLSVPGRFDGDASTTTLQLGGEEVSAYAESPRSLHLILPVDAPAGRSILEISEGGESRDVVVDVVHLDLTADRTTIQRGEALEVTARVTGLGTIDLERRPLRLRLENRSPETIELREGEGLSTSRQITSAEVSRSQFVTEVEVVGITAGSFEVMGFVEHDSEPPACGQDARDLGQRCLEECRAAGSPGCGLECWFDAWRALESCHAGWVGR